jgi:hypothetical protein
MNPDTTQVDKLVINLPIAHSNNRTKCFTNLMCDNCKSAREQIKTLLRIQKLKDDIKYNTPKARYQRIYSGGEEDALPTKRYVKKLKAQLAHLTNKEEK